MPPARRKASFFESRLNQALGRPPDAQLDRAESRWVDQGLDDTEDVDRDRPEGDDDVTA